MPLKKKGTPVRFPKIKLPKPSTGGKPRRITTKNKPGGKKKRPTK